ncbi:MAG: sigma-70 family RNA polymerase sigma factor [Planctomycetaceae bacterium]|jgi:RNA polymerase primary sigma factor|nr:sigma-70 family RNA polymerase sigma factor [Planctomycetaceae bacterium]
MSRYNNPAIRQLADQQVQYAPRDVRLEQISRAKELLADLDPETNYPYPDLCEIITKYRPDRYPDLVVSGEDAAHDLRCFVEDLSDSADLSVDSFNEPVLTVKEVSDQYNVSTKTVDRWRNRGLISRKLLFGNRKRIGFLKSDVDEFVNQNRDMVKRGARFSQLDEQERLDIIRRARRMARYGGCPSEISKRLSRKLGRSAETIRYTLKNYDQEHGANAIFPHASSPLSEERKQEILRRSRRGVPVDRLAEDFCRTKASVYRIISEMRARQILEQPIDFMMSDEFELESAREMILTAPPEIEPKTSKTKAPPGLPPYLASLYSIPLLTREEEVYYFRKMNYLKYLAAEAREKIDPNHPKSAEMDKIESLVEQAVEVKNFLIRSNLRLVVSIAKKHMQTGMNFFEMVSDGNMSLIRAIEKFNYTLGNKFSTYASWAIMKNYARSIPKEFKQRDRYRTGIEEVFDWRHDEGEPQIKQELVNKRQHQLIMSILEQLDDREKTIIVNRFGLADGVEPQTLEQVGKGLGVTKERIRQLEARALKKLRQITQEEKLEIPGL